MARRAGTVGLVRSTAVALCLGLSAGSALAQKAADPSGLWLTPCGAGYCGTLASIGGGELDVNNPDPALRSRKLVGIQILDARTPASGSYEGSLYNPKDGKTYSGSLTPKGPDTLEVAGCVLGVLCKRQTWTRVR